MLIEHTGAPGAGEILMGLDAKPFEARCRELEPDLQPRHEIQTARVPTVSCVAPGQPPRLRPGPPRYKLALLTWAGAYAVTLLLTVLGPATAAWPLGLRTLVLSALMVVVLTWLVIPAMTRLLRNWLTRDP
jgi:hypothetical protein